MSKLVVSEALQCPTLLENGFGGHRIEGIGDKHVPWIHNVRNTNMVVAVDDEHCLGLLRLFNEPSGQTYLSAQGFEEPFIEQLPLLGISSVANLLAAIKFAKYYELTENDIVLTVFTDSMDLYQSRLRELEEERGPYTEMQAAVDYHRFLMGTTTDYMVELGYRDRKRIHNLKYFTWVEQQGKSVNELNRQWYDPEEYWGGLHKLGPKIDKLIKEFNDRAGNGSS